jgi:hypothetical protein
LWVASAACAEDDQACVLHRLVEAMSKEGDLVPMDEWSIYQEAETGKLTKTGFDFVIPFVNGTDPLWGLDLDRAAGLEGIRIDHTRFRCTGEVHHLMGSVAYHMRHLVRRVVLVVSQADQATHIVERWGHEYRDAGLAIDVVPHAQLFRADGGRLPTFSSNAIEAAIHRIPNLSCFFFYSNDDMVIARPGGIGDFVRPLLRSVVDTLAARAAEADGVVGWSEFRPPSVSFTGLGDARQESLIRDVLTNHTVTWRAGGSAAKADVPPPSPLLLVEPVIYIERTAGMENCVFHTVNGTETTELPADPFTTPMTCPIKRRYQSRRLMNGSVVNSPLPVEPFIEFIMVNRELAWDAFRVAPIHTYAHAPRLIQRDRLHLMQQHQRARAPAPRPPPIRHATDIWTPYLLTYADISLRHYAGTGANISLPATMAALKVMRACLQFPRRPCEGVTISPVASNYVLEKLVGTVTMLDRKPLYFFVLPSTKFHLDKFTTEIAGQRSLFVTLNDNFQSAKITPGTVTAIHAFYAAATRIDNITRSIYLGV